MVFGAFGSRLHHVKRSAFFRWFNLTPAADGLWRPEGEAFRDQVALIAETETDGRLSALILSLERAMLDEPARAMFGRDIVKSFLEGVAGRDERMRALAAEIFQRAPPVPVLKAGAAQVFPDEPSAGFLTVMGAQPTWSAELARLKISMTSEGDRFEVRADRKPSRGFLARLFG